MEDKSNLWPPSPSENANMRRAFCQLAFINASLKPTILQAGIPS
jgi:hypothetical protein